MNRPPTTNDRPAWYTARLASELSRQLRLAQLAARYGKIAYQSPATNRQPS